MAPRSPNATLFALDEKDNNDDGTKVARAGAQTRASECVTGFDSQISESEHWSGFNSGHQASETQNELNLCQTYAIYGGQSEKSDMLDRPSQFSRDLYGSFVQSIRIIKADAVPLCAVAMGTGTAAASGPLFALAGNQSGRGGGDWTGWSGRKGIGFFLATSALSSPRHAPPDPDKICMCHNHQQHDPTPCNPPPRVVEAGTAEAGAGSVGGPLAYKPPTSPGPLTFRSKATACRREVSHFNSTGEDLWQLLREHHR
ncbi:unnamed protein product [Pleuronectes platessa]|uniref:Uncharacterized protein n=1 Tax=Pleuronectes platessa TaxID=8262 RepID=A0A9N7U578_PLEPL|nr:unnamed protein product [Pleuronectes platessa]